ncbi:MAG: CRISPR-associated endonuclease Cas2 [Spirochaetaceae bacterium]|nr:CRISPR-associated endonuclease Cas2 [Spirochaetaceae bacterium]
MSYTRFNAYKIMWLFCLFDLPTNTKSQRKRASDFRKLLIEDGYEMMQFSVYYRHCGSLESCERHIKYLQKNIPFEGKISILKFTDKQFGEIITFLGKKIEKTPSKPMQFELF